MHMLLFTSIIFVDCKFTIMKIYIKNVSSTDLLDGRVNDDMYILTGDLILSKIIIFLII